MKYGLSSEIVESFCAVFCRYPEIDRILLFGSRAAGNFRDGSDIDLAVLAPSMSEARFTALWNEVDALPIVFKTDLLHWDALGNAGLRERILQEGELFYRGAAYDQAGRLSGSL